MSIIMDVWTATLGSTLTCQNEFGNIFDHNNYIGQCYNIQKRANVKSIVVIATHLGTFSPISGGFFALTAGGQNLSC